MEIKTLRVVIPSRKRIDVLRKNTIRLFPYATLFVYNGELADYQAAFPDNEVVGHNVTGLSRVRQAILDTFIEDVIFMADDDIAQVVSLTGIHYAELDADDVAQIVENSAQVALDMGTSVFGYGQMSNDVRKFDAPKPFALSSWVGSAYGIIGRALKYDLAVGLHDDVDLCLQVLATDRILFVDERFSFTPKRFEGSGGNTPYRTRAGDAAELRYMKAKWGASVQERPNKSNISTRVCVKRRDPKGYNG